ncbi:tRNA (adenine(22)-N(1))-methyltransferase [Chengkuizengella sediminis]|uniref:tRNA (adenine(22)-N(1))-methyltransferase n=1 Tax=Chengkuizengella sediminis TaxID=1885917 RepID=UPI00138A537F|nr:class I SAM-dependent methyltransferase [Chengkuizengella sediminis]NDI33705.1 tRNA (adenine-N(1))-methyltransferase [Chengkuizengella sediminis]
MVIISQRLKKIANKILPNSKLADIGSDHALLPTYLAQKNIIQMAVAGEVNKGPYEAAKKQVENSNLQHMIQVRLGNGLEVLDKEEVDTIVIAGMGGGLITDILNHSYDYTGVKRLVLQPNVAEDKVRRWCIQNHWQLIEEDILEEDRKIYEILVAERSENAYEESNEQIFSEEMYEWNCDCHIQLTRKLKILMGPHLLNNPSPVFIKKWNREIAKREKVIEQLSQSNLEEAVHKKSEFSAEVDQLKEVLKCLQRDKQ